LAYRIEYKSSVVHDLKHMDKRVVSRVIRDLEEKLSHNPDCGKALSGQFKGLYKLRIGDYRVIYSKTKEGVIVLRIGHRHKVYD
jgi:mRNA interferase RelE/StbE